nr:hypothetical protein [Tanacetum cinerariifolium]
MLPIELTNDEIRNTKAYKEYYACATGEAAPKPKASARRKRSGSDTSITPPTAITAPTTTVAVTPRLTAAAKGKQPAKAKSPSDPLELGGFDTDEGTSSKLGVPDVPSDDSEEELSWNSSDDEDTDAQEKDGDDDEGDERGKSDDGKEDDAEDKDESPLEESGLVVLVFSPGDNLIACLKKAMDFLIAITSSRFPSTNNQLRTSSNPRNQATIQDRRVTLQQVQGKQGQSYFGTRYKSNATSSRRNNASGQTMVVKCYNCQCKGHIARKCTQPKRPRIATWYKDKAMLAEAQEAGQILDEEQIAFLADLEVPDDQTVQTIIPNNAAFQTEDLDTYDSDCDDISNEKAVLMANISNYGSDIISEKRFIPQQELSADEAVWYNMLNPYTKSSVQLPVKIESPKELSKDESCDNQNALEIPEYFHNNDLKAQLQENDTIIFKQAKAKQPLDNALDFACKHAQRIQELLVYVQDTCPNAIKLNEKKVDVTPKNK